MRQILFFCFALSFLLRAGIAFASLEIKTISIEPPSENETLRELIPFQPGDVWNSALVDILEKYLVSTQQFNRAKVNFDEKSQNLMISVEPRRFFQEYIWTEFKPSGASEIEQICFGRLEPAEISQSRISQINQCISRALQRQGYLDAKVLLIPDDSVLKIELLPGDRYRIRKINFEGNEYFNQRFLELTLNLKAGITFNPFDIREKTDELRALYLERGFFSGEIFQATVQILPAQRQVDLTWKIVEGDRYEVSFEGYHHAKAIFHDYIERGEALPSWFLDELGESIEEDLKQKGYLKAKVKKTEKRISNQLIKVTYFIEPGVQFRLTAPRFIGIDEVEQVLKIYNQIGSLRVGKRFHEKSFEDVFVTEFFERILDSGYVEARVQALEFSIDQARATVEPLIYMNLGPRYIINEAEILGEPEGFEGLIGFQAIRHKIRKGQIFNPRNLDELQANLQKELQANGFLDAEVSRVGEKFSAQGLNFNIEVKAGVRYRIASVLIRGLEKTQPI
ncbi:MAG: POTRA domain-containing protein, partial [Bdellovibrionota bacterium]